MFGDYMPKNKEPSIVGFFYTNTIQLGKGKELLVHLQVSYLRFYENCAVSYVTIPAATVT
jgi:hypothetical protein